MFSGIYGIFFVNYSHSVRTRYGRKNEADSLKEDGASDPVWRKLSREESGAKIATMRLAHSCSIFITIRDSTQAICLENGDSF